MLLADLITNVPFLRAIQEIVAKCDRPNPTRLAGYTVHSVVVVLLLRSLTKCGLKEANMFIDEAMKLDIQLFPNKGWKIV